MKKVCIPKFGNRAGINWFGWIPIPIFLVRKVTIDFEFLEETKYNWGDDRDQEDWNKLGGLVFNLWPRNKDAVLVGWRYSPKSGFFDVLSYVNENNGNYPQSQYIVQYEAKERGRIEITRKGNDYTYKFFREYGFDLSELEQITVKTRKRFCFVYLSKLHFGGANNSEGLFGGKTDKELCLNYSIKIN